jgi:hypothetical protein
MWTTTAGLPTHAHTYTNGRHAAGHRLQWLQHDRNGHDITMPARLGSQHANGNQELMPHGRMIHARNRSRQHHSQEMSVRALRRVAHQDGLVRLKTLYAVCFR